MTISGSLALLGLLIICGFLISDAIKNRPPNRFWGKSIWDKINWVLWFFGRLILPTLVFLIFFILALFYGFN